MTYSIVDYKKTSRCARFFVKKVAYAVFGCSSTVTASEVGASVGVGVGVAT
jgi:hypothetical protein